MYCVKCDRVTDGPVCPVCGRKTIDEVPHAAYWCDGCRAPVIHACGAEDVRCPLCGARARYLVADLRPVFPEERLLFECMTGEPFRFAGDSVWACNSKYFVNGEPMVITEQMYLDADADEVRRKVEAAAPDNPHEAFDQFASRFVEANRAHLSEIVEEACTFVEREAAGYPEESLVVSFSGGKDSTVTADIAVRALSNPYLVHVFGDTTLEFPSTLEYARRFKASHPDAIFKTARNNEQDFYEVAAEIGPPARLMRWCCSMFKTGPISRAFTGLFGNEPILTFYGIRKGESIARSKYNRVEDGAASVKIQRQRVAAPIFYWGDADVWLYILSEGIDFNEAYRLGYERVGCWCCPNNNTKAQFLSAVYMPERAGRWREFLLGFARSIGKPDPEVYVDEGWWKARQGGNGLAAAESVKVVSKQCATEDDALVFSLERPFSEELVGLMTPIGTVAEGLGRRLLDERVLVDRGSGEPVASIMPFSSPGYEHAVKVRALSGDKEATLRMARYQVIKYNACRQCLKCESLCRAGAITVTGGTYEIDPRKCTHCRMCVTDKYLEGGCLMSKYLKTKE